jgi:hypothetical protein
MWNPSTLVCLGQSQCYGVYSPLSQCHTEFALGHWIPHIVIVLAVYISFLFVLSSFPSDTVPTNNIPNVKMECVVTVVSVCDNPDSVVQEQCSREPDLLSILLAAHNTGMCGL